MKLKSDFVSQDVDGRRYLIPTLGQKFSGIARGNRSAAFLLDRLATETSFDARVDAMCDKYDAPREQICRDVQEFLNSLRAIGALEE